MKKNNEWAAQERKVPEYKIESKHAVYFAHQVRAHRSYRWGRRLRQMNLMDHRIAALQHALPSSVPSWTLIIQTE